MTTPADRPDARVDIVVGGPTIAPVGGAARPSLRVYFRCANAYCRVLRASGGDHYLARCPRCAKTMRFAVAPGGTQRRFFELSC